jgi:hypothetical protein
MANGQLWEEWRGKDYEDMILFFVFCNEEGLLYDNQFTRDHDLNLRLKTEWGKRSLVTAAVKGMSECFSRDQELEVVYMVCGNSVPLQDPSFFFESSVSREGDVFEPFKSNVQLGDAEHRETRRKFGGVLHTSHSQFVKFTRDHVDHMNDHADALEEMTDAIASRGVNPDEWLFGHYFEKFKLEHTKYPSMDRTMPYWEALHPHTWMSLEEERTFMWDSGDPVTSSLVSFMRTSRYLGQLFVRKVGHIPQLTPAVIQAGDRLRKISVGGIIVKGHA